jgi:hypothetical protein
MADELDQLNQQTQQDETSGTPVGTSASAPVSTNVSTTAAPTAVPTAAPLTGVAAGLAASTPNETAGAAAGTASSTAPSQTDLENLIKLQNYQKQLEAAGDPRAEEVRQQVIAQGQKLLHRQYINNFKPVTLDLSKSQPLPGAQQPVKLDLSKSVPLITNDLEGLIRLNNFQKRLEAAGDPRAEEVRQQAIKLGQELLNPEKDRSAFGKAWDWVNRGLISKDIMVRAISGMTPEQLNMGLSAYDSETPTHAAIREFVRGATQDTGELASSFTSPVSLALMGGGAITESARLTPELANRILGATNALRVAKTAKAVQEIGALTFGAQGLREMAEAGVKPEDIRNLLKLQGDPEKWSQFLQGASMAAVGAAAGGEIGEAGIRRLVTPDTKLLESESKLLESSRKVFDQRMQEVDIATKQAEQASAEAERLRQAEQAGTATRQQVIDAENAASKAAANVRVAQEALKQAGAARAEASIKVDRLQRKIAEAQEARAQKEAQAKAAVAAKAREDFQKAIPPSASGPASYTPEDYAIARSYLERYHGNTKKIDSIEGVRDALQAAQRGIENTIKSYIEKYANEPITTDVKSDVYNKLAESPNLKFYERGEKLFDEYDMEHLTISKADEIRNDLNAQNRGILKRNFWDVATALKVDPEFAARYAAAESLRDGIYDALEKKGVQGVREARQDEAAIIRVKNAASKQILKGEAVVHGSNKAGITRKLAAGAIRRGAGITGFAIGSQIGHPYLGYGILEGASEPLSRFINPGDLTRNQLIERSMGLKTDGILPEEITEGPVRPQFELPPELQKVYRPPQLEFTNLHNELATHYGEPVTQSTYNELEQRFLGDIRDKQKHGIPLDDSEKSLLVKVNQQISADALDLQKQLEDYQKQQEQQALKVPRKATLPDEAEGLLQAPEKDLSPGMSTEAGITHELAHGVVAAKRGIKLADGIRSHLHPENQAAGNLMSMPIDWSDFKDENGHLSLPAVRARAADLAAMYVAGGVANDLYHNIPFAENRNIGTDIRILRDTFKKAGFNDTQISKLIAQGMTDAARILSQPDVRGIIEDHAAVREKGLDKKYHISPERMNQILNDIGIGEEHATTTGNDTGVILGNREGTGQNEPRTKGGIPERGTGIVPPEREGNAAGGPAGKPAEPSNPKLAGEKPEGATEGATEGGTQRWEVIDIRTGKVMGSYESAKRARTKVNKLEIEYGGDRYGVRPVRLPENPKLSPAAEDLTNTEAPFETTDKELPLPEDYAEIGVTPRQIRVHEAGHHIVLDAVGFKSIDTISHLHPERIPGAAAEARWDQSPLRNSDGRLDEDKLKYRFRDVIAQLLGGPVAEELVYGVPIENNRMAYGDMSRIKLFMHKMKLSPEESELVLDEEKNRVKNILTKDGRLDILKKYTQNREANIPNTHHMTAGTTQKMLQEIRQGGQNDYDNKQTSGRTDRMGRQAIPREERGNEGGNSSSSEEEGAAAKGVAATAARQEEPENPKLSFGIPKERTTGDAERDEAIRQGGGIPAGVMKSVPKLGLPELTLFHDPQTGTTLALQSDTVTPELVRQHIMESRSKYAAGNKPKVAEETNEETEENRNDIRPNGAVRAGGQENVPAAEGGHTEATGQTGKRISSETPENPKLAIESQPIAAEAKLPANRQLAHIWNRWMGTENDERSLLENPQKYQLMNQGFERLGQILNVPVNMIPSVLWYYQQELDNLRNIPKENQLVEAAAR